MKRALILCGLSTLAAPAFAGELIPELVPAEVRWLAHVDVEALQKSALFQTAREAGGGHEFEEGLAELRRAIGADPLELVHSITLFSTRAEPETGVAILVVGEQANELLEKLKGQPGHRTMQVHGRELHAWNEPEGMGNEGGGEAVYAYVRRFEGVSKQLVFVSNERAELLQAVEVLEGGHPGLTDVAERRMSARPRPGSIVYVETSEQIPGLDGVAPVSAVAALANGLRFDFGETNGVSSAELVVTAKDAGDAQSITSVLQGVSALASLVGARHGGEELRRVVQALRFSTNGNQVGVEFQYDSRRLFQTLHGLHEREH